MTYPVTYRCPRCGALHELSREGYLADKAVTPYPFEGWQYVRPDEGREEADGVRFVCGDETLVTDERAGIEDTADEARGCGEPFYLSFVRFEDGEEIEPERESEFVEIDPGIYPPGPRGPGGSDFGR